MSMMSQRLVARSSEIAILDIGSNKSVCFIANSDGNGHMDVMGVGHMLSKGLRGGIITDAEEVRASVVTAISSAEEMAETQVEKVLVALTLPQIRSQHLTIDLDLGNEPISERDLQELMQEASSAVDEDKTILHINPFHYELDGQRGIRDPRGMVGQKLTCRLVLVTVPTNLLRNLTHCLGRCHLEVTGYVASAYASALSCLEEDEKELGVTLLDMGAFTTGYSVFSAGKLVYAGSIGVGSHHITQDIAQGLHTGIQQAERLKTIHGSAIVAPADDAHMIDVYPIGAENEDEAIKEKRSHLNQIIRPRVEEMFELTRDALEAGNLGKLSGNRLVLTGGGSQLLGIAELATKMFGKQVRIATPKSVEGLADATSGPAFATPIGMLNYAQLMNGSQSWMHQQRGNFGGKSIRQFARWFKDNF